MKRTVLPTDLANRFGHRFDAAGQRTLRLEDQGRRNRYLHGSTVFGEKCSILTLCGGVDQ
jgi:hypothetical protein